MTMRGRLILLITMMLTLCACANEPMEIPNYDRLIGKKFTDVIQPVARLGFRTIGETSEFEELENKRSDGCSTIFGVRKSDGVIAYWRISPSPEACKVTRKPVNV